MVPLLMHALPLMRKALTTNKLPQWHMTPQAFSHCNKVWVAANSRLAFGDVIESPNL
tara:strand:+ start:496 stop:666 length:171 start_codon:yes stop_codon:yes gene_type:complete